MPPRSNWTSIDMNLPGKIPLVNYGFRTHPEFPSLANATFAHGLELDDWHPRARAMLAAAVPVAMAFALPILPGKCRERYSVGSLELMQFSYKERSRI